MVVLPDHIHCLLTLPKGESDYSVRLRLIKTIMTKQAGEQIWQKRFWEHAIRDEYDFEQHVNYIHYNPVKHGLVNRPIDWRHSSIHKFIAEKQLPKNWACDGLCIDGSVGKE